MHDGATTCMSDSSLIHLYLDLNHRCSIFKEELKKKKKTEREGEALSMLFRKTAASSSCWCSEVLKKATS